VPVSDKPLLSADGSSKGVFVYIHGYNTTFEIALMRTGQLAWDLNYLGQAIAYSWPSQGTSLAYAGDQEAALWSVPHFIDYMGRLTAANPGPIDVIADGLGAVVLLDSATQLSLTASGKKFFGQLIFVVPDVDAGLFSQKINRLVGLAEHITVLVSPNSIAMQASTRLAGTPRAGGDPTLLAPLHDIDTVLLPDEEFGNYSRSAFGILATILKRFPLSAVPQLKRRNDNVWGAGP
jgi:esterase/lipase superfamily enzyme